FAFMLVDVPEPVWKTSIGNWESCLPAAISFAARSIARALAFGIRPSSPLTAAAAPFRRASQWITSTGTVSPEIGKFSTALLVSPPHSSLSFGIFTPESVGPPRSPAPPHGGLRERPPRTLSGPGPRPSAAERRQLARQAHRVVVGHQEPGARQDAELPAREQLERLFGRGQRVHAVAVGPQQQHRHVELRVQVEQLPLRAARPAPRRLRPGPSEAR